MDFCSIRYTSISYRKDDGDDDDDGNDDSDNHDGDSSDDHYDDYLLEAVNLSTKLPS